MCVSQTKFTSVQLKGCLSLGGGHSGLVSLVFANFPDFQLPGKREISRPKSISREISREKLYPGFAAFSKGSFLHMELSVAFAHQFLTLYFTSLG